MREYGDLIWLGVCVVFIVAFSLVFYDIGEREGLRTACNTAGGVVVAQEYCLPKTQVLKLTSP